MLYQEADKQRELLETKDRITDYRSEFRRDYGRLIHCAAFRRLQGKTQIFPGPESDFFRNRLTHSIEVAQIAKTIALKLNHEMEVFKQYPIDTDLVETIALAHDIGHPPFGHTGERALHQCMTQYGGFEGNAQTLRIVSRLEKKCQSTHPNGSILSHGLNLTLRTLAGILKYDTEIPIDCQTLCKGYYQSEAPLVSKIKTSVVENSKQPFKTLECQIMDIADDIAYSTYDTEDALKGGFINPLQMLSANDSLLSRIQQKLPLDMKLTIKDLRGYICEIFAPFLTQHLTKSLSANSIIAAAEIYQQSEAIGQNAIRRTELTAHLIDEFISHVHVTPNLECLALSKLSLASPAREKVELLKHYAYEAVIISRRLKIVAYRGAEIIKTIFNILTDTTGNSLLPDDTQISFHQAKNQVDRYRVICDFIASMSDNYAIEFYSRLKSGNQQSIFKPF